MSSGPAPVSRQELKGELQALLVRAHESGVEVEGGFECRNRADHPDWDVIVTEVEKSDHGSPPTDEDSSRR